MKKLFLILAIALFFTAKIDAQIGISATNTPPNPSAMLDVSSTTKGILIPRMTTLQKNAIANATEGMMVYDIDLHQFSYCLSPVTIPNALFSCNWVNFGNTPPPVNTWNTNGSDISNANSGNVGIGTITPASKLSVLNSSSSQPVVNIENTTTGNGLNAKTTGSGYGIYSLKSGNGYGRGILGAADNGIGINGQASGYQGVGVKGEFTSNSNALGAGGVFYGSGTAGRALITGDGNVGIGVAMENATRSKFTVTSDNADGTTNGIFGQGNAGISLQQNYPTIGFNQYRDFSNANTSKYMTNGFAYTHFLAPLNGNLYWNSIASGTANTATIAEVNRMVLTNDGKLGVNNASPNATFSVVKNANSISPEGSAAFGGTTYSSYFHYSATEDTYVRGGKTGSKVYINDGNIGDVYIVKDGGRVGIGMNTPNSTLEINGSQSMPFVFTGADYAPSAQDYSIIANLQNDANRVININLPSPVFARGRIYQIRLIQSPGSTTSNCIFDRERFGTAFNIAPSNADKGYVAIKDYNGDLITCLYEYSAILRNGSIIADVVNIFKSILTLSSTDSYYSASRTSITIQSTGNRWIVIGENLTIDQHK